MPNGWLWTLLASVIILAIGTSLKAIGYRFELKLANQVIDRLWKEIDTLKERNNQSVSDKNELPPRIANKVTDESHNEAFLSEILRSIAKYHSQELPATPERIAKDINRDPEITLAYMWKYHNDQYITFRTGGDKPGIKTPFFLSPKALEKIEIS